MCVLAMSHVRFLVHTKWTLRKGKMLRVTEIGWKHVNVRMDLRMRPGVPDSRVVVRIQKRVQVAGRGGRGPGRLEGRTSYRRNNYDDAGCSSNETETRGRWHRQLDAIQNRPTRRYSRIL